MPFTVGKDIFEEDLDVLVNPVNCVGVSGAGLAKKFKEKFPRETRMYESGCAVGKLVLGEVWPVETSDSRVVVYFPTKWHYSEDSSYLSIIRGLKSLGDYLLSAPEARVGLPCVGCGLGKLEPTAVEGLVSILLSHLRNELVIFPPLGEISA